MKEYKKIKILILIISLVWKKSVTLKLKSNGINIVSNLLEADAEFSSFDKGFNEEKIDEIYESVQKFIERDSNIESESNLEEE